MAKQLPLKGIPERSAILDAIAERTITSEQVAQLLAKEESHFLDFKAKEISPAKLTRTLSAFANSEGGELYIGISEHKQASISHSWEGFESQEDANGHVQALESTFPLGHEFSYVFLRGESQVGLVLKVEIAKTREIKFASDGQAYLRRGAQNLPQQSPGQLERLRLNKGITSFEAQTVDADSKSITNSETTKHFMLDVVPAAEPEAWMRKQNLLRGDLPTVAGLVLFSDEPQAALPKRCGIKVYRYKTIAAQGTRETLAHDPITIEGCLYQQIADAVRQTVRVVESISKLGTTSLEQVTYPQETLHEIITNAVLHRDYSLSDDVHVRVFDNRIEVESPGKLPGHITVQNILSDRFSRNGTIVRLINKFPNPPNKDVGEGLNTAFSAMRKLKLKDPVIKERANSVLVNIRHEPLASPEELILKYLETHPTINNRTARQLCYVEQDYAMKSILLKLEQRDMIERVPGTARSTTAYRLKAPPQ